MVEEAMESQGCSAWDSDLDADLDLVFFDLRYLDASFCGATAAIGANNRRSCTMEPCDGNLLILYAATSG